LAEVVPAQLMTTAVGVADLKQASLTVIAVEGLVAVRIGLLGNIALAVAFVFPAGLAALDINKLTVEVVVTRRNTLRRDPSGSTLATSRALSSWV
jgi:hypothetical protein